MSDLTMASRMTEKASSAHLVVRDQVMWRIVPDPTDRTGRHKAVDIDRAGAFQRDRLELLVFEHNVLAVLALVAFDLVFIVDRLAGLGIDIAGANAVAGGAIERMEAHLLRLGCGR